MEQYKQEFIEFMVDSQVLKFGDFTLKSGRGQHSKYLPFAFTREGIAMLSGLLRSEIAKARFENLIEENEE